MTKFVLHSSYGCSITLATTYVLIRLVPAPSIANLMVAESKAATTACDVGEISVSSDRGKASSLLKLVDGWTPDEALARGVESAMKSIRKAKLRSAKL